LLICCSTWLNHHGLGHTIEHFLLNFSSMPFIVVSFLFLCGQTIVIIFHILDSNFFFNSIPSCFPLHSFTEVAYLLPGI
jgi:hypothetical protein